MVIENVMYFALGLFAAGLVALMIMPAVWRRAVRLTKKRIEAATPMTMAEFRADKDQLRAEFALSTRRLEMNIEALRNRLAEQLREINANKTELAQLRSERDTHATIVGEHEARADELRRRVLELEKEAAELNIKLRARDRELADRTGQLERLRKGGDIAARPTPVLLNGAAPVHATEADRGPDTAEVSEESADSDLLAAEASLAEAENRLNLVLAETDDAVDAEAPTAPRLLAEKLSFDEEMAKLRAKVAGVEAAVMRASADQPLDRPLLREQLKAIASDVARLVYADEGGSAAEEEEESLFDRVQRFAADGVKVEAFPPSRSPAATTASAPPTSVADRLAALRNLRGGN